MAIKSIKNNTSKYSGVVKSIKGIKNTQQDEPRITPEQVVAAFKSFGLPINDRNHNDIAFWTMKGQSEGGKLIDELSKRRKEINAQEDASKKAHQDIMDKQNIGKSAMPRLSDEDIKALYDEYGLPSPDPEWARNHMPNDPKKIRSILEMQRKMADDMMKKHSKNAVNAIPEMSKMVGTPATGTSISMTGKGGPTPVDMQGGITSSDSPATPFFIGDHSIVRIANPNNPNVSTTWLVDAKKKILRPFENEQAFQNAFEDPAEAEKAVINISPKDLGPGGALDGFKPLQGTQGVKEDGSMDDIEFSHGQIQNRYGQQSDPAAENRSLSMLDGILGKLNTSQQ